MKFLVTVLLFSLFGLILRKVKLTLEMHSYKKVIDFSGSPNSEEID